MWGPTRSSVPDSSSTPSGEPVPCASTPRRTAGVGAEVAGAGTAAAAAGAGSELSYTLPSNGRLPSGPSADGTFLLVDDPSAAGTRDSFASIVDDPFFLRYSGAIPSPTSPEIETPPTPSTAATTPITTVTTTTTTTTTSTGHRNEEQKQPWIPPRKESLSITNPTPWVKAAASSRSHRESEGLTGAWATSQFEHANLTMEPINIAVIGAEGVGKSTFIQQLRRAPKPSKANITTSRHEVDGTPYLVTLVELDLEGIELDPNQPVHWPKQIGGHMVPRMDGALILYHAMEEQSMRDIHPVIAALANSSLPTLLVATKCDTPDALRRPDPANIASNFPYCVGHFRTSLNAPGSAQNCLHAMLRAALANRRDKSDGAGQRRRAASTANLDAPMDMHNGRPISQHSKHSRASSDFSLLRGFPPPPNSDGTHRGQSSRSPRIDYQGGSNLHQGAPAIPEDGRQQQQTVSSMLRTPGIRLDGGGESFLDVDESDGESFQYSDDIPILQRTDESYADKPARSAAVGGVSFDELVDRLLAPKMSKADQNFADVFLCFYRKFAAPCELLTAIRARLDRLRSDRSAQYLVKMETQMRIVEMVAKWLSSYPGDFARSATRKSLEELIRQLSTEPVFMAAAHQMRAQLEQKVAVDDDTRWAKTDPPDEGEAEAAARRQSDVAGSMSSLQLEDSSVPSHRRPSQSSDLSGPDAGGGPRTPARFQFYSAEDYERAAAALTPSPILPLNKIRYHTFMDLDADAIAEEITRIDWIMFSSIRIRDIVRHVNLSPTQREKCRSLATVTRMTEQFNHVARWTANMILIRDKPKHRAPCLEKFMVVASKLRLMNNYNGLAAVVAGITGSAVHRLAQTRALISPEVQKRFAGLVLLMSTQKSHFAYRLAWENSPLPRIPFMPLHRRDLVAAEEGSMTLVGARGERVNWKLFELLGEVLLPIMKSQGQPYPNLHRHEPIRELILDCRIENDDDILYERSTQVEPQGGGPAETSKRKFLWGMK